MGSLSGAGTMLRQPGSCRLKSLRSLHCGSPQTRSCNLWQTLYSGCPSRTSSTWAPRQRAPARLRPGVALQVVACLAMQHCWVHVFQACNAHMQGPVCWPLQTAQTMPVSDAVFIVQNQPTRPTARQHVCAFQARPTPDQIPSSCLAVSTAAAPARTGGAKRIRRNAIVESSDSEAEQDHRGCATQQSTLQAAQADGSRRPQSSAAISAADRSKSRAPAPAELQELVAELADEEAALQVGQGCTWGAIVQGPVSDVPVGQQARADMLHGASWQAFQMSGL